MTMNDTFNRSIDYLRISITDRCNLRCLYCMPAEGISSLPHSDILRYEEIVEVVRAAAACGVTKVRITGGEPLVRPGVCELIRMIRSVEGIENISLTTNGILLARMADDLASAGLDRVNVSLDTLQPDRFTRITRLGRIEKVLDGITAAKAAGLSPVKINSVIIRGFNDDEIIPLSEWALENHLHLRFIEFMPVNDSSFPFAEKHLSSNDIREQLFAGYPDLKQCGVYGSGPAQSWCRAGDKGSLGLIEAVSHAFCSSCNRIRLTADGKLKPCLFSNDEVDLLPALRGLGAEGGKGRAGSQLVSLIRKAIKLKPESHGQFSDVNSESRCMYEIGG